MNENVRDNHDKQSFELETPAGLAIADYKVEGGTIVFTHTEVPSELRGQGIGDKLARGALDMARERNLKVVPQCPFIRRFIERNSEYQNLLANE